MKQTAVEWLRDLYKNQPAYDEFILDEQWEKALEREKGYIKDAYYEGWAHDTHTEETVMDEAERYYNETFNQ